jgi:AraC-like DNA-binding protein
LAQATSRPVFDEELTMLSQDHLALRLSRLGPSEEWITSGEGLVFIFPQTGHGTLLAREATVKLRPRDVVVLKGSLGGKLTVEDGSNLLFWTFSLQVEHLFPLFASHELSLLRTVTDEFKAARHYAGSVPVAQECHRLLGDMPSPFSLDHRSQLLRVAGVVLSSEFKNAHARRSGFVSAEEHLTQVFEKLSVSEILDSSVDELARKFGCSRRHLNRLFHRYFGVPVGALRMEMRLMKAVSLLRDPSSKIITVAEQCGFNHLGLFNTCFKRRFGFSPGQWRKNETTRQAPSGSPLRNDSNCRMQTLGLCPWVDKAQDKVVVRLPAAPEKTPEPKTPRRAIREPKKNGKILALAKVTKNGKSNPTRSRGWQRTHPSGPA